MAQNKGTNNYGGSDASRQNMGAAGSTGSTGNSGYTGSTGSTGTVGSSGTVGSTATLNSGYDAGTPRRDTSPQPATAAHTERFNEARSSYQPPRSEVTVTERRSSARPSASAVIGSAVAAAVVGGAVPFMLAARKSRQSEDYSVHQRSRATEIRGEDRFDNDRSSFERSSSDRTSADRTSADRTSAERSPSDRSSSDYRR
jgi:hypothetical protein